MTVWTAVVVRRPSTSFLGQACAPTLKVKPEAWVAVAEGGREPAAGVSREAICKKDHTGHLIYPARRGMKIQT